MRATDYPVGGATGAAVLAIGRQARTVYAFRTFLLVVAVRPTAPRVPHYLPTSATRSGRRRREQFRGLPTHRDNQTQSRESLRTVRLERTDGASGGFLLPRWFCFFQRVLRSLSTLNSRIRTHSNSSFISFVLVSYPLAISFGHLNHYSCIFLTLFCVSFLIMINHIISIIAFISFFFPVIFHSIYHA